MRGWRPAEGVEVVDPSTPKGDASQMRARIRKRGVAGRVGLLAAAGCHVQPKERPRARQPLVALSELVWGRATGGTLVRWRPAGGALLRRARDAGRQQLSPVVGDILHEYLEGDACGL